MLKNQTSKQNDRWIPFNDELTCNLIRTFSTDVRPFNRCTVIIIKRTEIHVEVPRMIGKIVK